jgi:hypothetical protein
MAALEIPAAMGFNSKVFDIGHFQQNNPSGDVGFIQTINRSSPAWVAEYTTPGLVGDAYNETRSFLDLLEGSMNTFLAYDPRRPMPYAYRTMSTVSTPWGILPVVGDQDYANSRIALAGFIAGAVITKGDYLSAKVGDIWYLWRSTQNYTASGGETFWLTVKPRPQIIGLVSNTTIRYQKACIEMKMIGDAEETDSVESFPSFRFRAGQFTRRAPI